MDKDSSFDKIISACRTNILDILEAGGIGHSGGSLSILETLVALYFEIAKIDPKNPKWENRDRFILSKGHGVLGYYTALSEIGYIPEEDLASFEKDGTYLFGHPVMNRSKGIECSNGSLGMGLSLGIGVALAGKRKNIDYKVYVVMGDGECNEGSVWEAALFASTHKLDNLFAIVNYNRLQGMGSVEEIIQLEPMVEKWASFGWRVLEVNGHDHAETISSLKRDSKKCTGNSFLDQDVLKEEGVTDFEQYAVKPGTTLISDAFVDDNPEDWISF